MPFREESIRYLREIYLPRLQSAVDALPDAALWTRPHVATTSFGNLLLHLEGNVRQWILSGLGDAPDERTRAEEFAARDGAGKRELFAALRRTVEAACDVIARIDDFEAPREIQGERTDAFRAVYHVVEHFSWHTGQMVWMAKAAAGAGHGIAFYDDARLAALRNPPPSPA